MGRNSLGKILYPLLFLIAAVSLWQLSASLGFINTTLLPAPLDVFRAGQEVWQTGLLAQHIAASLLRVFSGFILAAILAIPLGLIVGSYKAVHFTLNPFIQAVRTISPIAWIPLAILWFGIGNAPAIFIIFITAFFPILISTALAVKNVDAILIKVAKNFGASDTTLLLRVILPAIFPYIIIALRVSLGISWIIIVAAEMVGMTSGLGYMILDARNFLRTDVIVLGMVVVGIIGYCLDILLAFIERRIKGYWGISQSVAT